MAKVEKKIASKTKVKAKAVKVKSAKPAKAKAKVKKVKAPIAVSPIKETLNKSGLFNHLAEESGVEVKSVKLVMAKLEETILGSLAPKGVGTFTLPGIAKFITKKVPAKKVPARKAGTMVRNPRTGEESPAPARAAFTKPASVKVKARTLGKCKQVANA